MIGEREECHGVGGWTGGSAASGTSVAGCHGVGGGPLGPGFAGTGQPARVVFAGAAVIVVVGTVVAGTVVEAVDVVEVAGGAVVGGG